MTDMIDIREHNRDVWNQLVSRGCTYTLPASDEEVAAARNGKCCIFLTPTKPIPAEWLGVLEGRDVLCLASGGGQQGPLLAAAGARVTVFDNSPSQLAHDRQMADRHELELRTVEGDMRDLSVFPDGSFDLIVHPVSNAFIPELAPVWNECFRALRRGGALLSGFGNPVQYMFDQEEYERGNLRPVYVLPYSDIASLSPEEIARRRSAGIPLEFSHTLEEQIGGQNAAGFVIAGFYEDTDPPQKGDLLSRFSAAYYATRARKL